MTNKILLSVFVALAIVMGGVGIASAQTATFPAGCSSGLGYSATTGLACSGNGTVITGISGCTTALGYSATTGTPCSGSNIAIQWLAGCSSTIGYSAITGDPCNGTNVATPVVITTPGLPTTGARGDVLWNIVLLLASAMGATVGSIYLTRNYNKSK